MLLVFVGFLPLGHRHAVLLGQLLVLRLVLGRTFPSLAAMLAGLGLRGGRWQRACAARDDRLLSVGSSGLAQQFHLAGAHRIALCSWGGRQAIQTTAKLLISASTLLKARSHSGAALNRHILQAVKIAAHSRKRTAAFLLGATATLQSADMLDAFAVFVGIFVVAINQSINSQVLRAIARLLACMLDGLLAFVGNDLTALFVCTTRDRAHARLDVSVKNFFGTVVRSVHISAATLGDAVNFCSHSTASLP